MSEEKSDIADGDGNNVAETSNSGSISNNAIDMMMQFLAQMKKDQDIMKEEQNMKHDDLFHQLAGVVQEVAMLNKIQQYNQAEIEKLKEHNDSPPTAQNDRVNNVAFSNMLPTTPHGNRNSLRRESFFGINRQQGNMRTIDSGNQGSIGDKISSRADLHLSVPLPQRKFEQRDFVSVNTVLMVEDQQREDGRASFGVGVINLDEYFKSTACIGLVKNDKKMKVAHSLHLDEMTWLGIDDETFLDMCARKIRSTKRTKEGFLEIFVDGLGKFTLSDSERWTVGVIGWSKHAEKALDDHITRARRVYKLMMRGKHFGEIIPPETYQKEDPGLINAYLLVIDPLQAYVKHYMGGEKQLNLIKKFDQFLDSLDLMNASVSEEDMEMTKQNSKLVPPPSMTDIVKRVQDKQSHQGRRAQYETTKEAIEKRLSVGHLHRQEAVADTSVDTDDGDNNSVYAPIFPLEYDDDSSLELPSDLYSALKTIPQDVLRSVVKDHQRDQQESSHDEIARLEYATANREKYPSTPDKKDMACYTQMRYGKCDKLGCGYDHDGKKAQAKLMEEFKRLLQSPYADKNQIVTMLREPASGDSKPGNPLPSSTAIPRFSPSSRPPGQQRTNFPPPPAGRLQELSGVSSVAFDTSPEILTHK